MGKECSLQQTYNSWYVISDQFEVKQGKGNFFMLRKEGM